MLQLVTKENLGTDFDTAGAVTPGKVSVVRATLTTPGLVRLDDIYSPASPVAVPSGSTVEGTVIGSSNPAAGSFTTLTSTAQAVFLGSMSAPNKLPIASPALTLNGTTHNAAGTDYAIGVNTTGSTSGSFDLNRNNTSRGFLKLTNTDDVQVGTAIGKSLSLVTANTVRVEVSATGVISIKTPVIADQTISALAPALSDNSNTLVTSAWVKAQGFHTSSGTTSFTNLTVTDDTILGQSSADSLVVSASSIFESPAQFLNTLQVTAPSLLDSSDKAVSSAWVKSQGYGGNGTSSDLGATSVIDLAGTVRLAKKTLTANTEFVLNNVPAAGVICFFLLDLTNGGAYDITGTWWSSIKWQGGLPPSLTVAGRDLLGFLTYDGGATWTGSRVLGDVS